MLAEFSCKILRTKPERFKVDIYWEGYQSIDISICGQILISVILVVSICSTIHVSTKCSAVNKLKFMSRPPDHPWWKTGWPESFLGYPNYFDSSLKGICFSVINTKFACFLFNDVPTYRELGRPSGDFGGHVESPYQVMGRIWRLGDLLSTALQMSNRYLKFLWHQQQINRVYDRLSHETKIRPGSTWSI